MKSEIIDETNFRELAKKGLKKYSEENMMVDFFFWKEIVMLYEKALEEKGD